MSSPPYKILILTPRSLDPLQPALAPYVSHLKSRHDIEVTCATGYIGPPRFFKNFNWVTLGLFHWKDISRCKPKIDEEDPDLVVITDLWYLPLTHYAKKKKKKVIYMTEDHNIHLRAYHMSKYSILLKWMKPLLLWYFKKLEKHYAYSYCDKIIVNSRSLHQYFSNRAHLIYYCSHWENHPAINNTKNPLALLYIGQITYEKGILDMLACQKKLQLPFFIIGRVYENKIHQLINKNTSITYFPDMSTDMLKNEIAKIMERFFIIGTSLSRPVNYSYQTQELNKDIDYMALGIPILGNDRGPTLEKIKQGAGFHYNDPNLSKKLQDKELLKQVSNQGKHLYKKTYSNNRCTTQLDNIINDMFISSE